MTCFRMKNGQTVRSYCKENGLLYWAVLRRMDEKGMTPEDAIADSIAKCGRGRKHNRLKRIAADGTPLIDVCRQHKIYINDCYKTARLKKITLEQAVQYHIEKKSKK